MWYDKPITFEEYVNKHSLEELFKNTAAANDAATQELILEWYFNYPICTDNEAEFERYFKRRVNLSYKRYIDQIRIMTVSGNMDPFIDHYLEVLGNTERTGESTSSLEVKANSSNNSQSTSSGDSTNTRTPDLVNETKDSHSETSENTRTDDLTQDTKSNGFGIAYPEANLDAIPATIDAVPSINYANSQQYGLGRTSNTGTQSDNGSSSGNGSSKTTSTGTEKDVGHSEGTGSTTATAESSSTNKGTGTSKENGVDKRQEKGRHQAIQDMLPQAIKAIRGCNALTWFLDQLLVCFDCFG